MCVVLCVHMYNFADLMRPCGRHRRRSASLHSPTADLIRPQWAFGAKITSYRRRCDVTTSHRRHFDVIYVMFPPGRTPPSTFRVTSITYRHPGTTFSSPGETRCGFLVHSPVTQGFTIYGHACDAVKRYLLIVNNKTYSPVSVETFSKAYGSAT